MTILAVFHPKRLKRLIIADAQNISRDPTLLAAIALTIVPAVVVLIYGPNLNRWAFDTFGISNFVTYTYPVMFVLPAFLVGWVTGFLFLEDRDDGPLMALDVTPIGKRGFFAYRAAISSTVTMLIILWHCWIFVPEDGIVFAFVVSALIASQTVIVACILPSLARNKVEGLAITKVINIAAMIPLAVFIPSDWRYLAAVVPTYWLGEILAPQHTSNIPLGISIVAAITLHAAVMIACYRLFIRRAG